METNGTVLPLRIMIQWDSLNLKPHALTLDCECRTRYESMLISYCPTGLP